MNVWQTNPKGRLQGGYSWGFLLKKIEGLYALEDLEPIFEIFDTFVCKKVLRKITNKYLENLKQASGEI